MHRFGLLSRRPSSPRSTAGEDERRAIAASGLFDAAFYLATSTDVAAAGLDPLDHFRVHGWREGRRPNLYFDPVWYAATHRIGDATAARNPLLHYIEGGEARGCRPVADFDPAWFREVAAVPPGTMALAHLLAHRHAHGFEPEQPTDFGFWADRATMAASGLFDLNHYLIANPDVREAARDPYLHFHEHGWREGRRPNPYFDPLWYRSHYLADRSATNPLAHYASVGENKGFRPSPLFDPTWYRATYGVAGEQLALAHFLAHRRSQRVAPNPHFDLAFYLARHGDEMGPNRDPFAHFLRWGALRELDPSATFDAAAYRRNAMTGVETDAVRGNALVHFLERLADAERQT